MKSLVLKLVAAFAILAGNAASAQAMAMPVQVACQTPLGTFLMPHGMPAPGAPCGNGWDHGITVLLSNGRQVPQFPTPAGHPGLTPQWPGQAGSQGPMGPRGQAAGMLGANREMQLAAECSAAGHPKAVAACIGGRLTTEELAKCKNGIGSSNGCFGPNNTIRVHLENAVKDITQGPGRGHDVVGPDGFTCKTLGICFQ